MKVNLSIELNEEQRRILADAIDGKSSSRLATRDDVREVLSGALYALSESDQHQEDITLPVHTVSRLWAYTKQEKVNYPGKDAGYVVGICKVKYARQLRA